MAEFEIEKLKKTVEDLEEQLKSAEKAKETTFENYQKALKFKEGEYNGLIHDLLEKPTKSQQSYSFYGCSINNNFCNSQY
jgi:cell division septum initiation protein DivIVA